MNYILKLECINDNWGLPPEVRLWVLTVNNGKQLPNKYWVAQITGFCSKFKYKREFLPFKKDYSKSNSTGTRGVYAYYILKEGCLYEVSEPTSWNNINRYFCKIENGELVKLSKGEVDEWLKSI